LPDLIVLFFEIPKSGAFPIPTRLRFLNRTLAAGQSSIPSPEEIRRLSSGRRGASEIWAIYSARGNLPIKPRVRDSVTIPTAASGAPTIKV
jgi:hypothetical protein